MARVLTKPIAGFSRTFLCVTAAGFSAICAAASAGEVQSWRSDLHFLADELPRRHANPYHKISRARFVAEASRLDRALPQLDRDQYFVRLKRLVSSIGDGHTSLELPDGVPEFGLQFQRFGSEYRLVSAPRHSKAAASLGARLLSINGISSREVRRRLLSLTPQDETLALRDFLAESMLDNGLILHGLGMIPTRDAAAYRLTDDHGHSSSIDARATTLPAQSTWKSISRAAAEQSDSSVACRVLTAKAVYCNFRSYENLKSEANSILASLGGVKAQRLIVDMRDNMGGNFCHGLAYVVLPVKGWLARDARRSLLVLIGPRTFSAAMSNAAHFRAMTRAILIGAPIGERPNSYQEVKEFTLPNTHWAVSYSTRFYRFAPGSRNLIEPDITVPSDWRDYLSGRDRALETAVGLSAREMAKRARSKVSDVPAEGRYCRPENG